MDEMPGMIRPDLQALPQVKERIFSPHLFPACAGVILAAGTRRAAIAAFPRTCGVCEKESRAVLLRMLFVGCRSFAGRPSDAGWAERFLSFR